MTPVSVCLSLSVSVETDCPVAVKGIVMLFHVQNVSQVCMTPVSVCLSLSQSVGGC